jgi:hypothetical protein
MTPALHRKPIAAITSFTVCFVYLFTIAPDLTWANFGSDGGELITASMTMGIPHPPGYPTYVLLGKLFSLLPIGSVAFRFNLFSAAATAVAAGLVTAVAQQFAPTDSRHWPALAAGLSFAFAPLVWGQAIITEVYGLNLLFLAAFLWVLIGKRPSLLVGLLLGLSITSHLTSLLMLPLAVGLTPRKRWTALSTGIALGLTPFLLLPGLAQGNSPVIWGTPATLSGWWWLVSGRIYHANLFSLTGPDWVNRAAEWAKLLAIQFTWAGLPLIAFAFYRPNHDYLRLRSGVLATAVLYILYALNYGANDAVVLLLPALLLLSLLLTAGLQRLGGLAFLLPATLLMLNYQSVNLSGDHSVRTAASTLLRDAPENAILLTPGDQTIFTLWYFQHVEAQRSDLILIDANLAAFDWYRDRLAKRYPGIRGLDKDDLPGLQQLNQAKRPFCTAALDPGAPQPLDCN